MKVAKKAAPKYKVTVNYYEDGTTSEVQKSSDVKSDLTSGTSGNYNCPAVSGYDLVTTNTLTYTIKDRDVQLICYYKKSE